jgi:cytochrome P450
VEIILRAVFGRKRRCAPQGDREELLRAMMTATARAGQLLLVGAAAMATGHPRTSAWSTACSTESRATPREHLDERSDVLSVLLQAKHLDGQPLSNVESVTAGPC